MTEQPLLQAKDVHKRFGEVEVRLPEGARIESLTAAGDRLIALVRTREGQSLGYVIDPNTGAVLGIIQFRDGRPDAK